MILLNAHPLSGRFLNTRKDNGNVIRAKTWTEAHQDNTSNKKPPEMRSVTLYY